MLQGRFQDRGPNSMPPNGRFMQQPSNLQRRQSGPNPFSQQMPQPPQMGYQQRANGPFQQPPKKEGLLGKLLGKSKQNAAPPNLFAPPSGAKQETRSSSGLLETLKNPDGISNMLNNTQKVLQAAEQFTPMIQQYGPIVKNLPSISSIWKVMRAFNSSEDKKEEAKSEGTVKKEATVERKQQNSSKSHNEQKPKQRVPKKNNGSTPKLYI
jgi:hypothetical protein